MPKHGVVLAMAASILVVAACGGSESGSSDPWGLGDVDLPDTQAAIEATFQAMPPEISGRQRPGEDEGEHGIEYGDMDDGGFALFVAPERVWRNPDAGLASPLDWLEFMAGSGEIDVLESRLVPDGSVAWFLGSAMVGDERGERTMWVAVWGDPEGDWVFTATAGSRADLDALIGSFATTVSG